jgi:hypothetical protein
MGARGRLQGKPRFAICLLPCKLSRYEGAAIILLNDARICMSIIVFLLQVLFLALSSFPGKLSILLSYNHCWHSTDGFSGGIFIIFGLSLCRVAT